MDLKKKLKEKNNKNKVFFKKLDVFFLKSKLGRSLISMFFLTLVFSMMSLFLDVMRQYKKYYF